MLIDVATLSILPLVNPLNIILFNLFNLDWWHYWRNCLLDIKTNSHAFMNVSYFN